MNNSQGFYSAVTGWLKYPFWVFFLIFFFVGFTVKGQQNKQDDFLKQFEDFKSKIETRHQVFTDRNDSIFLKFLNASWKKVSLVSNNNKFRLKPVQQPIQADTILNSFELKIDSAQSSKSDTPLSQGRLQLEIQTPISYGNISYLKRLNFYGIETPLEVKTQFLPQLKSISSQSIAEFYSELIRNTDYWKGQLSYLQALRSKHKLNDWGYYQLSNKVSQLFYNGLNETRLLAWFLLIKSGYKVKVGYDNGQICLIMATNERLFNVPYFRENDELFYVMVDNGFPIKDLETYDQNFPGNLRTVSLALSTYPLLQGNKVSKIIKYKNNQFDFSFNRGVLDFLSSYPLCELKLYFGPGLTSANETVLDDFFIKKLAGLSKRAAVDLLLDFCQFAFPYATDQAQFGKEKYLFPEESLFFPANDCEDRTVFLSYLIRRYLNLQTIALDFPDHVNLGVNLNEAISGSFVTFNGARYLICDPTYINAKSGMLSPAFANQKVKLINVEQSN
jgi:hypothetical protein